MLLKIQIIQFVVLRVLPLAVAPLVKNQLCTMHWIVVRAPTPPSYPGDHGRTAQFHRTTTDAETQMSRPVGTTHLRFRPDVIGREKSFHPTSLGGKKAFTFRLLC